MASTAATCAIISTDPDLVSAVRSSEPVRSGALEVAVEVQSACADITDVELQELRESDPEVVVLDLEPNISIGLKFAQFLADEGLGGVLVASATPQSPELLMEAMHAGVSEFLPKPVTEEETEQSLERVMRKAGGGGGGREERDPGEVIVFFSAKGGTGCTTLCTNTAVDVHRATRGKTLLVDLDLELGETAVQMGVEPRFSMVDLVRNFHRVDSDLLASYIEHHESGVDLLSAPHQPADFEAVGGDLLGRILSFLRRQYDYVLVDSPKTLNPATLAALDAADRVMLVTTPALPSLRNLTRCLPLLRQAKGGSPDDWARVVVNRHDSSELISLDQVEETTGYPVFQAVRNDYRTVMNAINKGTPAVMEGDSDFAEDVRSLAVRLTGVEEDQREDEGGWLRRLLGFFRNGSRRTSPSETEVTSHE